MAAWLRSKSRDRARLDHIGRVNGGALPKPGLTRVPLSHTSAMPLRPGGGTDGWEALFWLVFNRSSNPIVLLDDRQRVLEINEPATALLQRARGESLGRSLIDWLASADRSAAAREWPLLLRTGERAGSRVLVRPDGTDVRVEWAARVATVGERRVVIAVILDASPALRPGYDRPAGTLTRREREVVTLIALGHETAEIAAALVVSPETVKSHVRKAMSKLRAHTRAELVARSLATGQIAQVPEHSG
jgi:PAS domain S-box-containing protein